MAPDGPRPRDLIAALVAEGAEALPGPPALAVPGAPAAEVIAAARRLALGGPPNGRARAVQRQVPVPAPLPELRRLAAALFVDEHPSAPAWSATDRDRLADWVAVLIERRGEDGIQELIGVLDGS
ncbi:hypothetical protein OH807_35895 [Kitasatospora sp. NBC_01560]|uniref:hypothetical protein n=1 Tax=Kitasatospora sp. NBC_01560 TaxID=2975965 RepID=UPI0038680A5A